MASNLFNRYIWIVDTVRRYGRITRTELSSLWQRSKYGDGSPMPRRTFYNYRNAIAELFGIVIECDTTTYEYYIEGSGSHSDSVIDWMLNSIATGNILGDAQDVSGRIFVEEVPSAREYLAPVIESMRENVRISFSYLPYTRINPTEILLEPYFLKLFRQRWYVTGRNVRENAVKTYALDRMKDASATRDHFEMPPDFDPEMYTNDSFGIVFDQGEVRDIAIRATSRRAKYLRALPLHHSQHEAIHDSYSIFYYRMRLTGDLVETIMSMGDSVEVLSPPELRAWVATTLRRALDSYNTKPSSPTL